MPGKNFANLTRTYPIAFDFSLMLVTPFRASIFEALAVLLLESRLISIFNPALK